MTLNQQQTCIRELFIHLLDAQTQKFGITPTSSDEIVKCYKCSKRDVAIENHTGKSISSRFYCKISAYFVTAIITHLVRQAVSNVTGSNVQKVWKPCQPCIKVGRARPPCSKFWGGGGTPSAHPAPKLGGQAAPTAPAFLINVYFLIDVLSSVY